MGGTGKVEEVVKNAHNVRPLAQGRTDTMTSNNAAFSKKPGVDLSKSPNPRDWWGNRPDQAEVSPPRVPDL